VRRNNLCKKSARMVIDFYENILKFIFELAAIYVRVIFNSFFIFAFLWFIFTSADCLRQSTALGSFTLCVKCRTPSFLLTRKKPRQLELDLNSAKICSLIHPKPYLIIGYDSSLGMNLYFYI
jgi:hypothetical protein